MAPRVRRSPASGATASALMSGSTDSPESPERKKRKGASSKLLMPSPPDRASQAELAAIGGRLPKLSSYEYYRPLADRRPSAVLSYFMMYYNTRLKEIHTELLGRGEEVLFLQPRARCGCVTRGLFVSHYLSVLSLAFWRRQSLIFPRCTTINEIFAIAAMPLQILTIWPAAMPFPHGY